jgi:hypothetical protein
MFELLPAWLRFLEAEKLLDAQKREQTMQELLARAGQFAKLLRRIADPALAAAMGAWPGRPGETSGEPAQTD